VFATWVLGQTQADKHRSSLRLAIARKLLFLPRPQMVQLGDPVTETPCRQE
jgi:hypothetical protein